MPALLSLNPSSKLLGPVIGLNLWTFFMEGWMYATRIPAAYKYNAPMHPEATKEDFSAKMPPCVRWKADNFNHLLEQPTQFYAIALTLAMLGAEDRVDLGLAWTYVGLRVVHSVVQARWNTVMRRFQVFIMSSTVLLAMTARAGIMLLKL